MVRKLVLAVAAASALMSSNMVQALGVGEINLRSALNQPLHAEIELLQIRDLGSTEIRSVLASPDDFGKAGIDRSFFLTDLTFTPVVQPNGKAYIRVTSSRPVREPYLNFLMEVRWPSGRVLREFTLLLDPPLYDPTPVTFSAPVAPPTTASTGAVRTPAPVAAPAPTPARAPTPAASAPPRAAQTSAPTATDGQRRTTRADTLWGIALETRPQGSSVHQTMLAIQDLNPSAFIGDNINSLKAGQTLTLPNAEQAAARSRSEAIDEVNRQTSAWQNRQPAAEPAQRQLDARERSVAGDAPSQAPAQDTLRLVAGSADRSDESASSSGGQDGNLRDVLDQTKEQLDSAERDKSELADRLSDVEGQLETVQRLIALKDAQLAALQRELAEQGGVPDILPVPEDERSAQETEEVLAAADLPQEQVPAAEGAQLSDDSTAEPEAESNSQPGGTEQPADAGDSDEEQLALTALAAPAEQVEAGTADPAPSSTPPAPEPSSPPAAPEAQADDNSPQALLQKFMQNQTLLLATGAVALLALLLILMSIARRNARREAELTENYLLQRAAPSSAALDEGDDFNVALADAQEEAGQEFELDPLAEADELIAHGELSEAAEVLEEAIELEPARTDLRLKMMEVEARRENQAGYAVQLQALKESGVADSAIEMMNARYPLMAAGLVTGATLLHTSGDENRVDTVSLEQPLLDDDQVFGEPSSLEADAADFDFADFGLEEDTAASLADSTESDAGFDLDFDLDETSVNEAIAQDDAADSTLELQSPLAEPVEDDFSLDLDEDLQSDSLLAEFEALSQREEPVPAADVVELDASEALTLTDDDLAGFEAQLQTAMLEEGGVEAADQSDNPAGSDNAAIVSEGLMSEGLDEDFDFLSDTDECATKLDLARAYIDMGDEEGARDILAEVVEEGTQQQQQDARELMGQLD